MLLLNQESKLFAVCGNALGICYFGREFVVLYIKEITVTKWDGSWRQGINPQCLHWCYNNEANEVHGPIRHIVDSSARICHLIVTQNM